LPHGCGSKSLAIPLITKITAVYVYDGHVRWRN
jgi:hypothetical protein